MLLAIVDDTVVVYGGVLGGVESGNVLRRERGGGGKRFCTLGRFYRGGREDAEMPKQGGELRLRKGGFKIIARCARWISERRVLCVFFSCGWEEEKTEMTGQ